MSHTENTIMIVCQECPPKEGYIVGIDNMIKHILADHKTYTHDEAVIYANLWMEEAFASDADDDEEAARQSKIEHDIDEAIERDIRFAKHGE